ncbi:sugar phosphate isomerase/epimerase family protein [Sporosarcina sp. G11-34]|uniref:sugar phosphate isomerase/epimerase family protein n=1 Tax=Sporosarcina sp. G11-34 TaxID=2849605 RepID=UPI0022A9E351|nr:sugar phosphate isomerase/epimerase family protein [Sporosarcina sp. G11-34]MCZ2258103.1 sugar phosphate isomerase/epimerase [Sporosarcina sp. G11-34]
MGKYKYAVGVWAFGSISDRFCEQGYQKPRSFREKLKAASACEKLAGIEIHYNGDFDKDTIVETKEMVDQYGLEIAAINCELFGDRKFRKGALTSTDAEIRKAAMDVIRGAAEAAHKLGVELVNIWPGAEGHDYPFQVNFTELWENLITSIGTVVKEFPNQKFALEYKGREPRGRSSISTVGKSLLIIHDLGLDNLGVTLDFGHALQVKENPAESAAILNRYGKLFHVHMNDNTRDWDDDYMVGSYHFWETLEFFYYLKKINYQGWISLDITPAREDQIGVVQHCIEVMKQMANVVDGLDDKLIEQALYEQDALKTQQYLLAKFFGNTIRGLERV